MSLMKFYEGSEAKAQSYLDGLYLASDSNKLYYNGKSYTPDLTDMKSSIGTNVYTDSNYISKETNLTDAVLQLDEEIKATNDNLSLEHENADATYATKTELEGYLPLTGGKIYGEGLIISSKDAYNNEEQTLFLNVLDNSEWAEDIMGAKYLPKSKYQGVIVSIRHGITGSPGGKHYTLLKGGGLICSSGIRTYSGYGKNFVTLGQPPSQSSQNHGCDGSIGLTDKICFYTKVTDINAGNPELLSSISSEGFIISDKTDQDLLHAAGGTVSISDIIAQANVPTNVSQLTNDAGYQTEAQVSAKVSALVNSAPETLDTLKELADALGNDPNFATTISTELGKKLDTSTYTTDKATFALKSELPDMSQYTTTTSLQSTYVTKTTADGTYQPKGNYLTNVSWDQVGSKPAFATVATSGSYNDLTNKPTIPAAVTVDSALSSTSTNPVQNKVINSALAGKAASSHTHAISEITNLQSTLDGKAASSHTHTASQVSGLATVATSGSYNDLSNKPSIPQPTVSAASGNLTLWTGTESEYNSISSKDPNTLYFILES